MNLEQTLESIDALTDTIIQNHDAKLTLHLERWRELTEGIASARDDSYSKIRAEDARNTLKDPRQYALELIHDSAAFSLEAIKLKNQTITAYRDSAITDVEKVRVDRISGDSDRYLAAIEAIGTALNNRL